MRRYYRFAEIEFCLDADFEFAESIQMKPFSSTEKGECLMCTFTRKSDLSFDYNKMIFDSPTVRVYEDDEGLFKTYSLPLLTDTAAIIKRNGRNFECAINSKYSEYFSQSINLLNAVGMEDLLLEFNCFMLHCSFVDYHGRAILFSGSSGSGKSTRADMWCSQLDTEIVNGDKAGVFYKDGAFFACGLPIAGSSYIYKNKVLPLDSIVFLKKAENNSTFKADLKDSIKNIYYNLIVNRWNSDFCAAASDMAVELYKSVKIFVSECNLNPDSVKEQLNALEIL